MSFNSRILGTTAVATALLAQGAAADVTPAGVWENLRSYMAGYGYAVSANEVASGDSLTLNDVVLTVPVEGQGTATMRFSGMELIGLGDGTVRMALPSNMPMTVDMEGDDIEEVSATVNYATTGFDMIISGEGEDLTYTYAAASIALSLTELTVEDETVSRDMVRVDVTMSDLAGVSEQTVTDIRSIAQAMEASGFTYDVAFNDPDSGENGMFKGAISAIAFEGATAMPVETDMSDPAKMFEAGLAVDGGFTYGAGQMEFAVDDGSGVTSGKTSSTNGYADIAISADAALYSVGSENVTLDLSGPEIPLPISAQMAATGFKLAMPLAETPAPAPFELDVTLGGFTMSDLIWNIFDPAQILPRDPATILIDTSGAIRLLVDLFDEEALMAAGSSDELPAELESFSIDNLVIEAAGAKLTGIGSFTFDNDDTQTFDGLPRPIGGVDLALTGGYGLLDKLVQMGFVKEQDAMGARMMIGMFAIPGEGEDSLTSKVEINEQAHILVNGQRIQ